MPGTAMATQTPTTSGAVLTYNAAALTNSIANSGRTLVLVKNDSVASINVTAKATATADGNAVADKVVAVAAGAEKVFGPYPPSVYNYSDGTMEIDISVITSVTMAVLQVP